MCYPTRTLISAATSIEDDSYAGAIFRENMERLLAEMDRYRAALDTPANGKPKKIFCERM
jgi:hypothetical protein